MIDTIKKIQGIILLAMILFVLGCTPTFLVPSHPEKSKQDYFADKKECEKKARVYRNSQQAGYAREKDELFFTRECLSQKGWRYFSWD